MFSITIGYGAIRVYSTTPCKGKKIYKSYIYIGKMVTVEESLCRIEILKEGREFIARAKMQGGTKEYRNTIFEDLLRELFIDLQEEFGEI